MFLDRIEPKQQILNKLSQYKSVFLYSKTGVGKSALCSKIIENDSLYVKINHRNCYKLFEDGDIILKIKDEISNNSNEFGVKTYKDFSRSQKLLYSFSSFVSYIDDFNIGIQVAPIVNFMIPVIRLLKGLFKIIIPEKTRERWKEYENGKLNIIKSKNYLNYVFQNNRNIIININNIQTIDKLSFDFIIETSQKFNIRFLLEYTENDISGYSYYTNNFTEVINKFYPLKLENLPKAEVYELIKEFLPDKNPVPIYNEFLKTGDLSNIVKIEQKNNEISLNNHENQMLYLISLFNSRGVTKKLLFRYFRAINGLNNKMSNNILEELFSKKLIFKQKSKIHITEFNFNPTKTIMMSAFVKLKQFITPSYESDELIEALLPSYIEYDINNLIPLLPRIRNKLLVLGNKDTTIKILKKIEDKLQELKGIDETLILYVVDMYYSMALFKEAYEFLKKFNKHNIKFYIYEAMLLNRLDKHIESNIIIESIIDMATDRERIILLNIKMINYASLRNKKEIQKAYNEIQKIDSCKKQFEYNFSLRNSHLAINRDSAIKNIIKCISRFKRAKDYVNISRSLISLSILNILDNKLKVSKKLLIKAIRLVKNQPYELSVAYNNFATILLQEEMYSEAEKYLIDAKQMCLELFDKLSILGNLLTIETQVEDFDKGNEYINEILKEINNEPDKKLKSCLYDEIAKFYQTFNNNDMAKMYSNKSNELLLEINSSNNAVTTEKGYIINQLAFWHFDLYQII